MSPSRRCLSATWGGHLPAQPGRAALSMRKSCAKGSAPHRKIDRPGKIPDRKREVGSGQKDVGMGKMQHFRDMRCTSCFIPHQLLQAGAPRSRTTRQMSRLEHVDTVGAISEAPAQVDRNPCRQCPQGFNTGHGKRWHRSCSVSPSIQRRPPPAGRRQETQ